MSEVAARPRGASSQLLLYTSTGPEAASRILPVARMRRYMDKHWPGWRKVDSVVDTSGPLAPKLNETKTDTRKAHPRAAVAKAGPTTSIWR